MHLNLRLESQDHTTEHDLWMVRSGQKVALEVDGEQMEATVTRNEDGSLQVAFDDHDLRVEVTGDRRARIAGHAVDFQLTRFEPGGAPGEHETTVAAGGVVKPPMPGKITEVLVAVGDEVEEGQALLALEAMKMQSTLQAPRAGTVLALHVKPGQAVDATDVLVEIGDEPEDG